jgi:hypothetical protein
MMLNAQDFEWRAAELDELSAMMPDPEDDIFDLGKGRGNTECTYYLPNSAILSLTMSFEDELRGHSSDLSAGYSYFPADAPNSEYQQLLAMGMSDNSDFDDIMDEYL